MELGAHPKVKRVRKIGEGRRSGMEVWAAVIGGRGGCCKHHVAVKKVTIGEYSSMDVDWMQNQLEHLRRRSMWCRNVCTFHGTITNEDGSLCLVTDRCYGSIQSEMLQNKGRLTLEQILRYLLLFFLLSP